MLDIKYLRENPEKVQQQLKNKLCDADLTALLALEGKLRASRIELEELKAGRNSLSKEIGLKKQQKQDPTPLLEKVAELGVQIAEKEPALKEKEALLQGMLASLPNLPMDEIPVSPSAADNVCIKSWKEKPSFGFAFKNHIELGEALHLFDFAKSSRVFGANWPLYIGQGAELEWSLLNYMLSVHRKNGFQQIIPPLLVRADAMYGAGQLPKFEEQLFKLQDKDHLLYLIPTAEVALNALQIDEILESTALPLKYVSYTPCFRREAGAAGSQERGLIRTHQFNKVELFAVTSPEESEMMFESMLQSIEEVLQGLNLHYRCMLLTTGDMSFAAAKTVDIEVWLPGQNRYYEVSSLSNCTDFQARRSQIRFRKPHGKTELVHTLNGSGVATSRLMVALLENFQQADGSVCIPTPLQKDLGKVLRP